MRRWNVQVDGNVLVEQMQADVVGTDTSLSVGQRDNAHARIWVKADKASITTDTAIFPDYFLPPIKVHIPRRARSRWMVAFLPDGGYRASISSRAGGKIV